MNYFIVFCLLCAFVQANAQISGTATTTRYWDCCKPSCSWSANVQSGNPVESCSTDGVSAIDASTTSGCDDSGTAYACNDQQPWAVNDSLSYGFVAASFSGGVDTSKCCICLKLDFQGAISGKSMIVQVINTGGDLSSNQFDIQIPGGGVGIFTRGCSTQWGAPETGWGAQYGGVSSEAECSELPSQLQDGCKWRFEWFQNADNPSVNFQQIICPSELTSRTGCSTGF